METLATLPALAKEIALWFPTLNGRAFAVADAAITKENVPTLPVCMLALLKAPANDKSMWNRPCIDETFVVEFWFPPERVKRQDGSETPFYSFYDYDTLLARMLSLTAQWISPHGQRISYKGIDVEATQFATIIQFTFVHSYFPCLSERDDCVPDMDGRPVQLTFELMCPSGQCETEEETTTDNCAMPAHTEEGFP